MLPISSYPLDRYLWDQSRKRDRLCIPFTYQASVTFAAAGDQTTFINLDTDAPFVWVGLRAAQFLPNTAIPIDPLDAAVMIRYGGRGADGFAQTSIDIRNCAAPRPVPFVLPCVKCLNPGSQLFVTVTLRSVPGVLPASVSLQLYGLKAYGYAGRAPLS